MLLVQRSELLRIELVSQTNDRLPDAAMYESDLSTHRPKPNDFERVGKFVQQVKDFMTLGMAHQLPLTASPAISLAAFGIGPLCGLQQHPVLDELCHQVRSYSVPDQRGTEDKRLQCEFRCAPMRQNERLVPAHDRLAPPT